MAWDGWPPILNVSKRRHYKWIRQLWEAVRERQWMFGNATIWPRTNQVWSGGAITAIVDNGDGTWTITDSSLAPAPTGPGTEPDDGYYWNGGRIWPACCGHQHWVGVDCGECTPPPGQPYIPTFFDVIIQHDNGAEEWYRDQAPWAIVRGDVEGSTSRSIRFRCKLENYVTAKAIPSVADLIGKRFYLIKTGGLWWADKDFNFGRYPDWPNHQELWRGSADSGKMYADGRGYLFEEKNKVRRDPYNQPELEHNAWAQSAWADKEVLVYDAAGNLKRLTPTGNDLNTIFFGGLVAIPTPEQEADPEEGFELDYAMSGPFTVVPPGSRGWPERKPWRPAWWYAGAQESVYTHDPSDALVARGLAFAADSVEWRELESFLEATCEDDEAIRIEHDALDKDIWTSITNLCTPADHCFSPHLPKSLRFIQRSILELIPACVRPIDYTNAPEIPSYAIAQAFFDCNINAGTASIQSETSGPNTVYYFTVAPAYAGWPVYWEAVKLGVRKGDGFTASDVTGKVVVAVLGAPDDVFWLGASVHYSAGFTRWVRLAFSHMRQRGAFVPDVKTFPEGPPVAIYPPAIDDFCGEGGEEDCAHDCFGVGQWVYRGPSSGYKTHSAHGYAIDGINELVPGKVARYVGDNWLDPGTGTTAEFGDDIADLPYWDRFYEGQHPRVKRDVNRLQRVGTVTAASASSFTDDTKDWLAKWYTPNGVMRTETGIAGGGSSTTLVTTTSLTDVEDEAHCWWQPLRWAAWLGGKPYLHFVLEIDKQEVDENDEPITRTYKVPIVDVTDLAAGQAPVLHFAEIKDHAGDVLQVEEDDVWRIVEPATTMFRWRGLRVKFIRPDLTTFELELTHDDVNTAFFAKQTDPTKIPQVGWVYEILEPETGGCWRWQLTEPTAVEKAGGIKWQKITYTYVDDEDVTQTVTGYWVQPYGIDARAGGITAPWHEAMEENLAHLHPKMFGLQLKGDSIGIHLYDECFKLLNRCVWTMEDFGWDNQGEDNHREGSAGDLIDGDPIYDSDREQIETNQADAAAQWSSAIIEFPDNTPPRATSATLWDRFEPGNPSIGIETAVGLVAVRNYGHLTSVPDLIAHAVSWMAYATIRSDDPDEIDTFTPSGPLTERLAFDDSGTGLQFRRWTEFGTTPPAKIDDQYSELLGNTDEAPHTEIVGTAGFTIDDTVPSAGIDERGYYVAQQKAILKWNVAGGLQYVDWQAD